jgi:hypothetical protein
VTPACRWITQDEYDKKAYELKQGQYELNDKLKRVIEADENYSMTLITLYSYNYFIKKKYELMKELRERVTTPLIKKDI